jgi:hypothetical protein
LERDRIGQVIAVDQSARFAQRLLDDPRDLADIAFAANCAAAPSHPWPVANAVPTDMP